MSDVVYLYVAHILVFSQKAGRIYLGYFSRPLDINNPVARSVIVFWSPERRASGHWLPVALYTTPDLGDPTPSILPTLKMEIARVDEMELFANAKHQAAGARYSMVFIKSPCLLQQPARRNSA